MRHQCKLLRHPCSFLDMRTSSRSGPHGSESKKAAAPARHARIKIRILIKRERRRKMRLAVAMANGGEVECCCQATTTTSTHLLELLAAHSVFDRREHGDALPVSPSFFLCALFFVTVISRRPRKVTAEVRCRNYASVTRQSLCPLSK